jgi:hypothetical protein
MVLEIILKYAKELLITNGGLSLFFLIIYSVVHRHDHKKEKEFFTSHHCSQFDLLLQIKEQLDNDEDRKKMVELKRQRMELAEYARAEDEVLSHEWLVGMRDYIKSLGYSVDNINSYTNNIIEYSEKIWSCCWDEKEKALDKSARLVVDNFRSYASMYMTHLSIRIAYVLLKNISQEEKEKTIDSMLIESIKRFTYFWENVLSMNYGVK